MMCMRRLLIAMVLVAAVSAAPAAVLAATPPQVTAPAYTNVSPVILSWADVRLLPTDSITYRVFRSDAGGAACPATRPGAATDVSNDIVVTGDPVGGAVTYPDPVSVQGAYCYYVQADDAVTPADSDPATVTYDTTPPSIAVDMVEPGSGGGCTAPFRFSATASDSSPTTMTFNGASYTPGTIEVPDPLTYAAYSFVNPVPTFVATDAAGNASLPRTVPGRMLDSSGPGPAILEVSTDPSQLKATLSWADIAFDGAPITTYLSKKGPQGSSTPSPVSSPVIQQNLQVDATYEFKLYATDACNRTGLSSTRLVRLNDTTPPTAPILTTPAFDPAAHMVSLTWVASSDNIQVDHYEILRNGVPVGATDAPTFTDTSPSQHSQLGYVVRAVDTNGNETDSAPATVFTPDWTPPTAPVLTVARQGAATAVLRWTAASDNVGVVAYDVLRDGVLVKSMTSAERTWSDTGGKVGNHAWEVRARDAAGLSAVSAPQQLKILKSVNKAVLVSVHLAGKSKRTARYSLAGRARLLIDVRVQGTLQEPKLRLYVKSGHGRVTVWRGTPGSSAPRLRLGSKLARRGYVTVDLRRALHAGRLRFVVIASDHLTVMGDGVHQPKLSAV
jgi:hypothetical protein